MFALFASSNDGLKCVIHAHVPYRVVGSWLQLTRGKLRGSRGTLVLLHKEFLLKFDHSGHSA